MGKTINEHITQLKKLKCFHNGSYGADIDEAIKAIEALEEIKEIVKHWATGGDSDESMVSISEMLIDKGVETVFERVKALEDEERAESEE